MADFAVGAVTTRTATVADRPPDTLGLRIGDLEWRMWSELSVTLPLSLADGPRSATLSLSAIDPRAQKLLKIVPSLPCVVSIGGDDLITGYIDEDSFDPTKGAKYTVKVRSKAADVVDCSVDHKGVWKDAKVERIASELCAPYNVKVIADTDTGAALPLFVATPKEKTFAALDRLARERGLLFCEDGNGDLHITTITDSGDAVSTLERGRNIETLSRTRSVADRFSEYRVHGQTRTEVDAAGTMADAWMTRRRLLVIDSEKSAGEAECKRRAAWEACVRAGKSVRYSVVAPGWRIDPTDSTSSLYLPNRLHRLLDAPWDIDATVLTGAVTLDKSAGGGTRTSLSLGSPYGYMVQPPQHKRGAKGKARRMMVDWFDSPDFDGGGYEGDGDEGID